MIKIYFFNSGCSAENLDFRRLLALTGAEESTNPFKADAIIANFCGISTDAFKIIPEYMAIFEGVKEIFPETRVYVGGCAEGIVDLKARYPFIDGTFGRRHMLEDLSTYFDYDVEKSKEMAVSFYNCVHIQSGCARHCGFCKKAYMDMTLNSRPIGLVIKDIKDAIANGYPDIVLLAENSTEYGFDLTGNVSLIDLLKAVIQVEGVKSILLTALCIDELSLPQNKELLQFIKECNLIHEVQIEIQSLIPEVRKAMKLTSSVEAVLRVLDELKGKRIITNIMVGYPGETDRGFDNELKLIEDNNIYYIQINKYDDTPLVYAHSLEQIPEIVVSQRMIRLASLIRKLRTEETKKLIETTRTKPVSCIFTTEKRWAVIGESAVVNLGKTNAAAGDIVKAKIIEIENLFNMQDPNQTLCLRGTIV